MTITDKRGYRPLCPFCHDAGCSACESTRAQRFAAALEEAANQLTSKEAAAFMRHHLKPLYDGSRFLMLPRTEDELLRFLILAFEYARQVPTPRPPMEPENPPQRFDLLEWRDP